MWNEEPPHHNPHKALRWSSNFVYRNNYFITGEKEPGVNGSKIDIATGTYSYQSNVKNGSTLKLMPGEDYPLSLQAIDELGQKGITIVIASEVNKVNSTGSILLDDIAYLLFPKKIIPFSFQVPEKTYNETVQKVIVKRKLTFFDVFSVLTNSHSVYLEIQPCYPGFIFSRNRKRCICDTNLEAIQRCDNSAVYLKEGYWANISDAGHLVTYSCPLNYCNCTRKLGLPGCFFNPENPNGQCAENREGWMCGKCKGNTSVGLRLSKCIECETSGWMLGVVTAIVIGLCVFIIWLNPGISSELRGPLFFFQVLPFIVDTTSKLGEFVSLAADVFNFGGPFIYLIKNTCILQGISNLHALAFGYIIPASVLFVFLLAYFLSTKYYLTFKLRRHSMLPSFWLLLVFVYNYLVSTSFLILFCPKVGGKHVFFYDGTITCFHGNHLPMGIIALMVLVFMVIPPPIVVVLITNGFWRLGPQYMDTLSISLRRKFRWWWSVDLARRVLIVVLFALVPNEQIKKILMIVVCNVILVVHTCCQPYTRWRSNITESIYLLVLNMLALMQYVEYETNLVPRDFLSLGGKADEKPWKRGWFETPCEKTSVVLLVILSIHTVGAFFYKAVCFCSSFDCNSSVTCCARAQVTLDRSGYQEIENTSSDQSVDAETERRKEIMDIIFKTRPQTQLET